MKAFLLILVLAASAFCAELRLSDYCTPNDGLNDAICFQTAANDLINAGGGTIIISAGEWNIGRTVSFVTYDHINNSITIRSEKGAVLRPNMSSTMFVFGNQNQVIIQDLIVLGNPAITNDVGTVIMANYVNQLRIDRCEFIGLKASNSVINVGNADAVIRDSAFNGLASGVAVIQGVDFKGLTVSDSEFFDYGHFNGNYYSKTHLGNHAWIKLTAVSAVVNAAAQRVVNLHNVRFDEGAQMALDAKGVTYLQAHGIMANLSGIDGAAGFKLDNVKYAEIKMSKFGYAQTSRPAIKAMNNTTVFMNAVTIGNGVFYGEQDSSSEVFFNQYACDDCGERMQRLPTPVKPKK